MDNEEILEEETQEETNEVSEDILKMRIEILNNANDSSCDDIFEQKLADARGIALYVLYPYDDEKELPDTWRMKNWIVRCAIELYHKMSTLNVQSYSENGLSVSYLTGSISKILLDELVPNAGVIKFKKRCCCQNDNS
ncbi:MAG: hypothetical protein J6T15_03760 [Bacilli bacterium]|nr:hypothetical protein [Bacilli bacterium]